MQKALSLAVLSASTLLLLSCTPICADLEYALKLTGPNRPELETVFGHYRTTDVNPQKLSAAEFLIVNTPAHYSYAGSQYYGYAT